MKLDIFFSISQTPVDGQMPTEKVMFENFFSQVEAADELGFGVAWVAESHLSSEIQKSNKNPVIPHWQGEVGLNTDILQLAARVFQRCRRIEVGSAVMNILCNGGPVAHAERVSTFLALHGMDPHEKRRLHVGFAAGRFEFMNRAAGIAPRTALEEKVWPQLKGKVFAQGAELFVRLLNSEILSSSDVSPLSLSKRDFRTPQEWDLVREQVSDFTFPSFWNFEKLQIIPKDIRRELLNLTIGSHDPFLQESINRFAPVQVFNLSITSPSIIDDTHLRMDKAYHPRGGPWVRGNMPRTVFVFLNEESGLTPQERSQQAQLEAKKALGAYWAALEGTLDPKKVEGAANNALIGNADEVAAQILERFHPEDRLMLWFDFFNHDSPRVIRNMENFKARVVPLLSQRGVIS